MFISAYPRAKTRVFLCAQSFLPACAMRDAATERVCHYRRLLA
jgi:hypothetical protein